MPIPKKNTADKTATERGARRDERIRREGGKRLGWLDAEHTRMLTALIDQRYAEDATNAVARAIAEAYEKYIQK